MLLRLSTLACLFFSLLSLAQADSRWPEFRGPSADGHAQGEKFPVTWSETENIAWKTPIQGRAWSSPVVWDDQIWLTTASDSGTELFGICVSAKTGEVLFNEKLFDLAKPPEIHKFNSYASPSPAIEEGRVYLSWGSYGLACLDTRTFQTLWIRRDLECDHYRGPGSSPIVHGKLLIQHYDGFDHQYVVALDKQTGDTVWKTHRPHNFETDNGDYKKAYATPLIIQVNGREQLISPTSKGVFSYDPQTGEEIWRMTYSGFSTACRPLYGHGLLYISSGFSKGEMFAIRPDGTGDVTQTHVVWNEKKSMPSKPSPLLIGNELYTMEDRGVATCLDALTGKTVWVGRVGGNHSASPIYAGGHIYFFDEEGTTTVVKPGPEYQVVATNKLGDGFMSSPAVVGNALILRSRSALYRVQLP
jgi:outer membrane protein assembly factor BamB